MNIRARRDGRPGPSAIAEGADYVLPVKGNRKSLLDDLKAFDADFDCAPLARTLDKAHGRLKERTCALVAFDGLSDDLAPLPGRRQALRIVCRRTVLRTQKTTTEVTYGLTSLGPDRAGPAEILALNRGHWRSCALDSHPSPVKTPRRPSPLRGNSCPSGRHHTTPSERKRAPPIKRGPN